jgi:lipopolysaccharide/colanic/teichoic acid biosynthesis glycosyltransferase
MTQLPVSASQARDSVVIRAPAGSWAARTLFDRLAAAVGLVVLSPILLLAAVAIVLEDALPVFFRQIRVGCGGKTFQLWKFRSMRNGIPGTRITAANDARLTCVGRLLRKYKIDELPQLWNVLKGDMNLVGPRPEVPAFVDLPDPAWQKVLQVKPGITDLASLVYRHEEEILGRLSDAERYYRDGILPAKLALNDYYIQSRSFKLDLKLILLTVRYSFFPRGFDPERVRKIFLPQENT